MFSQACVILFTGGVCLSACWDNNPPPGPDIPPEQTPLGADTPLDQTPPGSRHPPGADTPLEQTSPGAEHAGRYDQRAGGTHLAGRQSYLQ